MSVTVVESEDLDSLTMFQKGVAFVSGVELTTQLGTSDDGKNHWLIIRNTEDDNEDNATWRLTKDEITFVQSGVEI